MPASNLVFRLFLAAALCGGVTTSTLRAELFAAGESAEGRSAAYRDAQRALDAERYADAIAAFSEVAARRGADADAALYWKAYAEQRAGRKADALRTVRELKSAYPKSSWIDDAEALEVDLGVAPAIGNADEELKLYAVDALLQADPERALPILEKVLAGTGSLKLKERALFVLSQSDLPRAREVLLATARSGKPEELQLKALQVLGIAGDAEDVRALAEIYRSHPSLEVRRQVLEAYMIAGEEKALAEAAKAETDVDLRRKAVEMLGAMGASSTLRGLWASEQDPRVRATLLDGFAISGDVEALLEAAKKETDLDLRRHAIQGLGITGKEAAGKALVEIYRSSTDRSAREAALDGLMIQSNGQALLQLFREEKDPELKKLLLQRLSIAGGDEATDELIRLLEEKP